MYGEGDEVHPHRHGEKSKAQNKEKNHLLQCPQSKETRSIERRRRKAIHKRTHPSPHHSHTGNMDRKSARREQKQKIKARTSRTLATPISSKKNNNSDQQFERKMLNTLQTLLSMSSATTKELSPPPHPLSHLGVGLHFRIRCDGEDEEVRNRR